MKIFKLLQNPLVKNAAIIAIIYFAFFSNKNHPESLGVRLSPDNLKKDFSEITSKSTFILSNVKMAENHIQEKKAKEAAAKEVIAKLAFEDVEKGLGEPINCGDTASITYNIFDDNNQEIYLDAPNITIGSQNNLLLEQKIIGMRKGGVRTFKVPPDFQTDDETLKQLLANAKTDLKYQIKLEEFSQSQNSKLSCNQQ